MAGEVSIKRKLEFKLGDAIATLVQNDSIKFMKNLDRASVDLFVTSPPYFIGKEYDSSTHVKDFEMLIREHLAEIDRVLKTGGSVCWQVGNHISKNGILPLDYVVMNVMEQSNIFQLRNRIIWTFSHGNHANRRFSGRHETILWYTKGIDYFFNLDVVRVPQKYPGKRYYKGPKRGEFSGNPLGKNPGDFWDLGAIWDIPNVKAKHVEKTDHPCQYPIALVRRLVLALSPKGGVVLDPFIGSGTTAVAALMEGRNFFGCDIVDNYLQIAESRLNKLLNGTLKFRKDIPIRVPVPGESVAIVPDHFKIENGE